MQDGVPHDGTAIDKALDVLFELAASPVGLGVTELSRRLDLPKSSTHRLLTTLTRRGLVERDGPRYRTGMALVRLGAGVLSREPLIAAAKPYLRSTANELGETAFLVAARGGRLVVLDRAEGSGMLRASPEVGSIVPVHATAVGKLQLAFAPEEVEQDGPKVRFTEHTRGHETLSNEVRVARRQGYAESHEEWQTGLSVVAAPIRASTEGTSPNPGLVGTLAVAIATARLAFVGRDRLIAATVNAAKLVEKAISGSMSGGA